MVSLNVWCVYVCGSVEFRVYMCLVSMLSGMLLCMVCFFIVWLSCWSVWLLRFKIVWSDVMCVVEDGVLVEDVWMWVFVCCVWMEMMCVMWMCGVRWDMCWFVSRERAWRVASLRYKCFVIVWWCGFGGIVVLFIYLWLLFCVVCLVDVCGFVSVLMSSSSFASSTNVLRAFRINFLKLFEWLYFVSNVLIDVNIGVYFIILYVVLCNCIVNVNFCFGARASTYLNINRNRFVSLYLNFNFNCFVYIVFVFFSVFNFVIVFVFVVLFFVCLIVVCFFSTRSRSVVNCSGSFFVSFFVVFVFLSVCFVFILYCFVLCVLLVVCLFSFCLWLISVLYLCLSFKICWLCVFFKCFLCVMFLLI